MRYAVIINYFGKKFSIKRKQGVNNFLSLLFRLFLLLLLPD